MGGWGAGVCVCLCVCESAEHLPSPVHNWSPLSTAQAKEKGKLPPYCASELMGSQLHSVLLGSKKPRTLYHTAGLMLAFAAPEGSPCYSLTSTQFPTAQEGPPTIQQGKARFLGPSTPEQGSQKCGNRGSLTA